MQDYLMNKKIRVVKISKNQGNSIDFLFNEIETLQKKILILIS